MNCQVKIRAWYDCTHPTDQGCPKYKGNRDGYCRNYSYGVCMDDDMKENARKSLSASDIEKALDEYHIYTEGMDF